MAKRKVPVGFRIDSDRFDELHALAKHLDKTQIAVLELAIQRLYAQTLGNETPPHIEVEAKAEFRSTKPRRERRQPQDDGEDDQVEFRY